MDEIVSRLPFNLRKNRSLVRFRLAHIQTSLAKYPDDGIFYPFCHLTILFFPFPRESFLAGFYGAKIGAHGTHIFIAGSR